jgi:hypothetical protein
MAILVNGIKEVDSDKYYLNSGDSDDTKRSVFIHGCVVVGQEHLEDTDVNRNDLEYVLGVLGYDMSYTRIED